MPHVRIGAVVVVVLVCGCAHHPASSTVHSPPSTIAPKRLASARQAATASPAAALAPASPSVSQSHPFLPPLRPFAAGSPQPFASERPLVVHDVTSWRATSPITVTTDPPVPYVSANSQPQIVSVQFAGNVVTGGQQVVGDVVASSNTASIEVRVGPYGRAMQKTAPGLFQIALTVPQLPFFLRNKTYTVTIIARNTRGDAVTHNIPITVR